ncbi:MAG: tetratricopeptide repeat protein [Calditrichaeota bacterium]|nr:tetratricopeptide repeat protein [Calditrichota bacterium]
MATETYILIGVGLIIILLIAFILIRRRGRKIDASLEYTTALNYLIAGDKDAALDKLRLAVRNDTHNIDAYLKIGDILRERGFYDRAVKIHRGLLIRPSLNVGQRIDILKSLIADYKEAKRFDRALVFADQLAESARNERWAQDLRLKIQEAAGDWDHAFETRKALYKSKDAENKKILALYKVEAGRELASQGKEHEARLKFREAIKLDGGCPPAYLYLSDSYARENRFNDALTELKRFIEQAPDKAYLAFQRFRDVLFHIGNFGEVESIFRKLLEKDPNNEPVRFALADIYERKGELQRAIALCQNCLEKNANSMQAKRYLAKFLPRIGKTDEALKYALELADDLFEQKEKFYACKNCGHVSEEPLWRCPNCLEWDTFVS